MLQQTKDHSSTLARTLVPPKRPRGRPKGTTSLKIPKQAVGRPTKNSGKASIKTTVVFDWNRQAQEQIIMNRGGRGSSKSYSVAQLLVEYFFTIPKVKILILRKTQPSLRLSVIPLVWLLIDAYNLRSKVIEHKQDRMLWSPVRGLIHFGGLDDPEKIKSTDWNFIWTEEATEFTYDDFVNLKMTLRAPVVYGWQRNRIFMTFNPTDEYSFLKTKIIQQSSEDVKDIHSSYQYNPFLSPDYRRTIEALISQDSNYWRIFGLGEWGKLEHLIYRNWTTVPYLLEGESIFGLDFGYNNPTSLIKCTVDGLEVGVQQKIFKKGMTNSDLVKEMKSVLSPEEINSCPIYADNAEPQRIEELSREGFWIVPANKSVKDGIDYVKRCRLKITDCSDDITKEIRGYSYKTDRQGRVLEEPVKFDDHCMDAIRYAVFTHYRQYQESTVSVRELDFGGKTSPGVMGFSQSVWDKFDDM